MKCSICNEEIEEIFLGKIDGTFVKKKPVCSKCQKKYVGEKKLPQ